MDRSIRQRSLAKWSLVGSCVVGVIAFAYFAFQGSYVTGVVAAVAFAGIGALEYRRQLRDLEVAEGPTEEDPFERRKRR